MLDEPSTFTYISDTREAVQKKKHRTVPLGMLVFHATSSTPKTEECPQWSDNHIHPHHCGCTLLCMQLYKPAH